MKHKVFTEIVMARVAKCEMVLGSKDKEYSSGTDRLHNFKSAARARNQSVPKALDGMMMKHLCSMWDEIDKMEKDPRHVPSKEWVNEKLGDVINYTLLLEGVIEDRRDELNRGTIADAPL